MRDVKASACSPSRPLESKATCALHSGKVSCQVYMKLMPCLVTPGHTLWVHRRTPLRSASAIVVWTHKSNGLVGDVTASRTTGP